MKTYKNYVILFDEKKESFNINVLLDKKEASLQIELIGPEEIINIFMEKASEPLCKFHLDISDILGSRVKKLTCKTTSGILPELNEIETLVHTINGLEFDYDNKKVVENKEELSDEFIRMWKGVEEDYNYSE